MPAPAAPSGYASNSRIHPSVVRVIVPLADGNSLGSGVLVHKNARYGVVVTNHHVVRGCRGTITIVFSDGFQSAGQLLKADSDWDLAAIAVWRPDAEPVTISNLPPRPGDVLTIAGYGSGAFRMQTGRCTQYFSPGKNLPRELVELEATARQGDSGGPIFNSQGELAGVLFGEGGGRTIGSYGGRVERFLADVVPQVDRGLSRGPQEMIAEVRPPSGSDTMMHGAREEGLPEVASPPRTNVADDWRPVPQDDVAPAQVAAKPVPPRQHGEDARSDEPRKWPVIRTPEADSGDSLAAVTRSRSPLFAAGDGETARLFTDEPRKPAPDAAEYEQAAQPDATATGPATADVFSWRDLSGPTPWDQTKSVLATIGGLVVLVQVLRVFGYFRKTPAAA